MTFASLKIRRSFRITIYILCTLAGIYTVAWYIIADQLERGIARWTEDRRSDGWTVKHGSIKLSGYPLTWRAFVDTPDLAQNKRNPHFHWSGSGIALKWEPWKSDEIGFEVTGRHLIALTVDRNRVGMPIDLAQGKGQLRFGPKGSLQRLQLLLDGAKLAPRSDQAILINRLETVIDTTPNTDRPPKPHLIPWLRLNANIFGLTLPKGIRSPLGRTVGKLVVRSTFLGEIPRGRPADALAIWQKSGGTVEVAHLELGWASLVMKANGTLALDSALQPVGALMGKVSGYNETLDALVTANLVKPGAAMVARFVLGALSQTPPGAKRPEIEVPVSIQESWLFVGPVKLVRIPKIAWH